MNSIAQIRSADVKTADLVSFYNANVPEASAIKKFADRKTAVERCVKLAIQVGLPEFDEEAMEDMTEQQKAEAAAANEAVEKEIAEEKTAEAENDAKNGAAIWAAAFGMTEKQKEIVNNGSGTKVISGKVANEEEEDEPIKTGRASNSAGVAASWADPSVMAARLTRHGVAVEVNDNPVFDLNNIGQQKEFKSTRDAFRFFRLPDSKHIRFRMRLKEVGHQTFELNGKFYHFELREITKPEVVTKDGAAE